MTAAVSSKPVPCSGRGCTKVLAPTDTNMVEGKPMCAECMFTAEVMSRIHWRRPRGEA